MARNNWTREEHILAFNLYCKIPFTKINAKFQPVKDLANIIGRSHGSVAMKLANFARLDPALQAKNISGLSRGARGEEDIWIEFNGNWDELAYESELLLAKKAKFNIEETITLDDISLLPEGKERKSLVKSRVNQSFFRKTLLASYNYSCCITGINATELLVAGHIRPWGLDTDNRLNPRNGLLLNSLHDKAFESGFLTITPDYKIRISNRLEFKDKSTGESFFYRYHNQSIQLPSRFLPDPEFLEYHNNERFLK